jgi:hypothetical protein
MAKPNQYQVLRDGRPMTYDGKPLIITSKKKAKAWVDNHTKILQSLLTLHNPTFTIEKVEKIDER